jgi:hypothetical protein
MSTRYLPRHNWYLADALVLLRELQAIAWPAGWHLALGGGVLNHGYSDKDLDLYVLPIYSRPDLVDELTILSRLADILDSKHPEGEPVCSFQGNPHECYTYAMRFSYRGKQPVELFIVRRSAIAAP